MFIRSKNLVTSENSSKKIFIEENEKLKNKVKIKSLLKTDRFNYLQGKHNINKL